MAVYTKVSEKALQNFLSLYDIGDLIAYNGITEGVENSNFFLQTSQSRFILTLYEKRVLEQDLPYFLKLMEHLAKRNFPCPTPIIDKKGHFLNRLENRPAAIISFLEGDWKKKPSIKHCQMAGYALAELHIASQNFPMFRSNDLDYRSWPDLFAKSKEDCKGVLKGLSQKIEQKLEILQKNWPNGLPSGVIHGDLFPDNVFFSPQGHFSGMIDFYFACNDMLAYDLAICLNAWCFEDNQEFNSKKAQAIIIGYHQRRPLKSEELDVLPVLACGAAMRFFLTRLYDWINVPEGALVQPKDPMEYYQKLTFHMSITKTTDYGIIL